MTIWGLIGNPNIKLVFKAVSIFLRYDHLFYYFNQHAITTCLTFFFNHDAARFKLESQTGYICLIIFLIILGHFVQEHVTCSIWIMIWTDLTWKSSPRSVEGQHKQDSKTTSACIMGVLGKFY